jgi:hypothetical protein
VRFTSLCALGAVVTTLTLAACSDSLEPPSTSEPADFHVSNIGRGPGWLTVCHVWGPEGRTRYLKVKLPIAVVYGRLGHLNKNGTARRGHERDFIVTGTNSCPPKPVTTGTLYICKIAGDGVALGSTFSFTVNGRSVTATALEDLSSNFTPTKCANAGTYAVGTTVVLRETASAGVKMSSVGFNFGNGGELISFDQDPVTGAFIGITATVGEGPHYALVTNAAS